MTLTNKQSDRNPMRCSTDGSRASEQVNSENRGQWICDKRGVAEFKGAETEQGKTANYLRLEGRRENLRQTTMVQTCDEINKTKYGAPSLGQPGLKGRKRLQLALRWKEAQQQFQRETIENGTIWILGLLSTESDGGDFHKTIFRTKIQVPFGQCL